MKLLIVPKPVLNEEMEVKAYCFRYKQAEEVVGFQPSRAFEGTMSSPCMDVLNMVGLDAFTNGLPIFVPLNKITLLADIENQCKEPADKVIFLLDENTQPESPFLDAINRLKDLGYRFALENIVNYDKIKPILALCDFLFIDGSLKNREGLIRNLLRQYPKMKFIASDVNDMELFHQLQRENFKFFEGIFYSVPVPKGYNSLAPVKVNSIQLLNLVRQEDFEIEEVAKIVRKDPSLSISLLKFINSPYLGLSSKVRDIQHAVALLGQMEARKWVITAVSGVLASDKPDEITKRSLMRAKFAENLAPHFHMADHAQSLFMMGLFSILDVVLDMPISRALEIIVVSENISEALIHRKGEYGNVMTFITTFENANWNEVSRFMILNRIGSENVFHAYINAAQWYGSIIAAKIADEK